MLHVDWGNNFQGRCEPACKVRGRNRGKDEVPKSLDCDEGLVEQQVFKVERWTGDAQESSKTKKPFSSVVVDSII